MTTFDFEFPIPPGVGARPRWTGETFDVGNEKRRVIAYDIGSSGWTEELTRLHEVRASADHFIDVASRKNALDTIGRFNAAERPIVLEIGCSSGYFLSEIVAALPEARVMGADYTLATLEAVGDRIPNVPLLRFDLTQCPLPDASVDVVVMLNVLEHIERDDLAMRHVFRILKRGGLMVAEVPAGPGLFDWYDRLLLHRRRYDMTSLERLARAAGFVTLEKSHLGFLLYPGFWLTKKLSRVAASSAEREPKALVERSIATTSRFNRVAYRLMAFENWLRRRVYLPVGIRCLIACRKPASSRVRSIGEPANAGHEQP